MHAGEYLVTRLIDEAQLAALVEEAVAAGPHAGTSLAPEGAPHFFCCDMGAGGPGLAALRDGPGTLAALRTWTGEEWLARNPAAAPRFTYYRQPFHFSGLHRDTADCGLSVITCIVDTPGPGGDLVLFPGRCDEPLEAVRADPENGAVTLRLAPGESLLIFGSAVPHAVTPVAPGRTRIVFATCYRRVTTEAVA